VLQHKWRHVLETLLCVSLCALLPLPVAAAWPHDPLNGNVPICTASGVQSGPVLAADGAGGGIVAWQDDRNPSAWAAQSSGTTQGLNAVWGTSGSNLFAVGLGGTIRHFDGAAWSPQSSGSAQDLYGVWGSGASDVYAVGLGGTILHYDGTSWSAVGSGTLQNLYAVWGSSAGDVFAVGSGGTILHYNGISWGPLSGVSLKDLHGVWGSSGTDVFAVGSSGVVEHYNGTSWTLQSSSTLLDLFGTWGVASNSVYAVGRSGAVLHYDGLTWKSITTGASQDLYGVSGSSPVNIDVVGAFGTILHFGGSGWTPQVTGTLQNLAGVAVTSSSEAFAAGAGGTILHQAGTDLDIYAQRVDATGALRWTIGGVALCVAANAQQSPAIAPDGAGGAIVAWQDFRSGIDYDIYVQRVDASGNPQWTVDGVALCSASGQQVSPAIVSDGAGGAIVTWQDLRGGNNDIYAQRVDAAGVPQWTPGGVAVCTAAGDQTAPVIGSDGSGGAVITWQDARSDAGDIYAQRIDASGAVRWTAGGVALCVAAGTQTSPAIVADGAGGGVVAWQDFRNGANYDIYAQRVSGAGASLWTANGAAVCAAGNDQTKPAVVSDGAGGVIVSWQDLRAPTGSDIYAQRIAASGLAVWPANGVPLCAALGDQVAPAAVSDGIGGAIVAWQDLRGGLANDVYAQRVSGAGIPQWTTDGVAVSAALNGQQSPAIASDGAGGGIAAWQDTRSDLGDVYAQRIEHFGVLGSPEPSIASVADVPNDQGTRVKVSWHGSYLDSDPTFEIASYSLWRSSPPNLAMAALRAGALLLAPGETPPSNAGRVFTSTNRGAQTIFWELVGSQIASGDAGYSLVARTTADSVAGSNPQTLFRVQAHDVNGISFWNSAPDSGYSVDNLPPGVPASLSGNYAAGAVHLHWSRNVEPDLSGYRIYRGASAGFVPDPGNLIASPPDTGYADPVAPGSYYKLSAVDIHGNESQFALLSPSQVGSVPEEGAPAVLEFSPASPNPAKDATGIHFELPATARVSLVLYDVSGRSVRVLVRRTLPQGRYTMKWDLRSDGHGAVPAGVYFARLAVDEQQIVRRIIVVR
jgi:hypothetical protein